MRRHKGVAIILVLGVLSSLLIVGVTLAVTAISELYASRNYCSTLQARYASEGGLAIAIAQLKTEAQRNFEDALSESWASGYSGTIGGNSYSVSIVDEQRKVNLNFASQLLLSNLPGMDNTLASRILGRRSAQLLTTIDELRTIPGITDGIYAGIAGLVTVNSYVDEDSGHTHRSPVNVNTADRAVLKAVFWGISDGTIVITETEAEDLADHIITARQSSAFASWDGFNSSIDLAASDGHIPSSHTQIIKDNCNPNRAKPTLFTTELCFNSGGCYELSSTGNAVKNTITIATAHKEMIVSIFDMWNQTTELEFKQAWLNHMDDSVNINTGDIKWITFRDSCPVRSDQDWNGTTYDRIPGSLKLGYWEDFQPIPPETTVPSSILSNNAIRIRDWTSYAKGSGAMSVNGGRLECGTFTQGNIGFNNGSSASANMWNTQSIGCTISMKCSDKFYYQRGATEGEDAYISVFAESGGTGNYGIDVNNKNSGGREPSVYPFPSHPARITLKINSGGSVAGYMSSGYISGTDGQIATGCSGEGPLTGQYTHVGAANWVDNVRMIPGKRGTNTWNGRYISTPLNLANAVKLGRITGTVTIPSTASAASETVTYAFCPDGAVDSRTAQNPGDLVNPIQYVVYFKSSNTDLFETPVLEDITITYLDRIKVLYLK